MSTAPISRYYNTRKREVKNGDSKLIKNLTSQSQDVDVKPVSENVKTNTLSKTEKNIGNLNKKKISSKSTVKKKSSPVKKDKSVPAADKKSKGSQPTLAAFFSSESDEGKVTKTKKEPAKKKHGKLKGCFSCVVQRDSIEPETAIEHTKTIQLENSRGPQSPKRNIPTNADKGTPSKRNIPTNADEGTPTKRKHLEEDLVVENKAAVSEEKPKESARRKLQLNSLPSKSSAVHSSNSKLVTASPKKDLLRTPDKLDALINQSRSKLLLSPKLDELKKSLALFSEKASKIKEFQSNPYRINAVISTSKSPVKTVRPTVFASDRFGYLLETDGSSLVLPAKYKIISEMFRSMEDVVGILNNRKEKITFDKVKEGVQKMMKRNFDEKHLGQIITILPTAYNLSREKCSHIARKSNSLEYQLVISLNMTSEESGNNRSAYQPMNPACKINRMNEFNSNLLDFVKKYHEAFLARINFPNVSRDDVTRWHPKFVVDAVPDIPVAPLPELPEAKVYTAKDVLNKLKDGFRNNKVGKALQSVADESENSDVTLHLKETSNPKPEKQLEGVCSDLLAKIRAKESAKLLQTITQNPAESKRRAMEERVPKIVNILWHYFIAEQKRAVPIDLAVEKIIHSFNSLTTPDAVKEHLILIKDKFPGWLSFIEIPKGVYLTIDKKRNINDMLTKAALH